MSEKTKAVAAFLNQGFVNWQHDIGGRKTQGEFAEYLKVEPGPLGHWMNARNLPSGVNVDKIADKLGPRIYDLVGLRRPASPEDEEANRLYVGLSEERKKLAKAYLRQLNEEQAGENIDDRKRPGLAKAHS